MVELGMTKTRGVEKHINGCQTQNDTLACFLYIQSLVVCIEKSCNNNYIVNYIYFIVKSCTIV